MSTPLSTATPGTVPPPARRPARPAVPPMVAAIALALLLGLQPVTTDLYLPALPLLTRDLGGRLSDAQATMSVLILSFGFGQLVWGSISDRLGRRPVLLAGLSLYLLACAGAALAGDMAAMIALRGAQGLGMAASVVCARALVRDLYEPHEGTRVMALGMSGLGAFGIACPLLGGAVTAVLGWRGTLGVVGLIGLALLVFVMLRLPETLPRRNLQALHPPSVVRTWGRILRNRRFQAYAGLSAATYAGLFVFLSTSSFICMGALGLSSPQYGAVLVSSSIAYLAGTLACRRWLAAAGAPGAVRRGAAFTLLGGVSMAACALAGIQTVWAVLLPQWLYAFGHGIHQPCGQAGAVSAFPEDAGAASALAGFTLASTAFGMGLWLAHAVDGSTRALGLGVGASAVATATIAWTWVQRHGHTSTAPA